LADSYFIIMTGLNSKLLNKVKSMVRITPLLLTLLIVFTFQPSQAQWGLFDSKKVNLKCENLRDIKKGFLIAHINTSKMTPALEARTVKQHIEKLDPMKIYFTQQDMDNLKKELKGIFNRVNKGDCEKLFSVYEFYKKKVAARVSYAKGRLNKNFKFDKSIRLMLDPDKRGFQKSQKALEALQEKYLHFQISNRLITGSNLKEAIKLVSRSYDRGLKNVKKYKNEDVLSGYLNSFAHSLDPHTSYFSADVLEDFEIQMSLSLEGIGATLTMEDGFTVVDSLVKGGAAERSGELQPKDKIIAVGQYKNGKPQELENVFEWELRDVVRKIRGPKGSQVQLKVLRKEAGKAKNLLIVLIRDEIKLEDEAAQISYVDKEINGVKRKLGIINLPSFYADSKKGGRSSAADVKKLISEARTKRADGLILDMSSNGGGSLSDAVDLAGLFFRTGNVVKQSSKNPRLKPIELEDKDRRVDWPGPLVILTSRISASASEIVAGALKDYQRGVVVGGDHTFGKGSVQQVIPLAPGLGALKVTVGMFFTPGGFSTQHKGVDAHIAFPSALDDKEIGEKTLDYSLPPKKITPFLSKDAYVTSGPDAWQKIDSTTIQKLKKRSLARVSNDKDFQEIVEEVKKAKAEEGKGILIGETLDDRKDKKDEFEKKKKLTAKEKLDEYHKRADVREAMNVLVDLIDLQKKVPLKIAKVPNEALKKDGKKAPANAGTAGLHE
jgi:carboxyl-terminal processing protease